MTKKSYEKPSAEVVEFDLYEVIMDDESQEIGGSVGAGDEGVEDW